MERRTFMKAAGTAGATAAAGGLGVAALAGSAAAHAEFSADKVEIDSADGSVQAVYIKPKATAEWENFDEDVESIEFSVQSRIRSKDGEQTLSGYQDVHHSVTEVSNPDVHSSQRFHNREKIPLYDGADTEHFEEDEDGATNTVTVDLLYTVTLRNGQGEPADPEDEAELEDVASFWVETTNVEGESHSQVDSGTGGEAGRDPQ